MNDVDPCRHWFEVLSGGGADAQDALVELTRLAKTALRRGIGRDLAPNDIEDLAFEAVERVLLRARGEGEPASYGCGYLVKTARNRAVDVFRARYGRDHEKLTSGLPSWSEKEGSGFAPDTESTIELRLLGKIASKLGVGDAWLEVIGRISEKQRLSRDQTKLRDRVFRERARLEIEDHARISLSEPESGGVLMQIDRVPHGNDERLSKCQWIRSTVREARITPTNLSGGADRLQRDFHRRDLAHPAPRVNKQIGAALDQSEKRWGKLHRRCWSAPEEAA